MKNFAHVKVARLTRGILPWYSKMYKDVSGSIRRTRTAEARKTIFRAEKPNTVYCQGLQPMGIRGNPMPPAFGKKCIERESRTCCHLGRKAAGKGGASSARVSFR